MAGVWWCGGREGNGKEGTQWYLYLFVGLASLQVPMRGRLLFSPADGVLAGK